MKWIKANERLPEKEDFYYVKFNNGGMSVVLISGSEDSWHKDFQWLDESNDEAEENRKLKDALKQIINYTNPVSGMSVDGDVSIIAVNALTIKK